MPDKTLDEPLFCDASVCWADRLASDRILARHTLMTGYAWLPARRRHPSNAFSLQPSYICLGLMRHAHISTTMDHYGNASTEAKRKANRPIVQRLLRRSANQQISMFPFNKKRGTGWPIPLIGQFWTVIVL
jgi:hypothetical protein